MIARAGHLCAIVAVLVTAAVAVPGAGAQPPAAEPHLLEVPYLPQSEALCGGAALAMVMRFYGESGVYAETFSSLVDANAGGIRGADLMSALRARGWRAESFRGDARFLRSELAARRPVVALIEDRPGRFHYVVVVGWSGDRVIVHDPARAPFRLMEEGRFEDAWSKSDHWALVARPGAPHAASSAPGRAVAPPTAAMEPGRPEGDAACGPLVDEGVRLAAVGDLAGGRRLLEAAAGACPSSAAPSRELAGIHALANEWPDAARAAQQALAKDPGDALAARILGTARFLDGHPDLALDAWNRLGEPRVDLVNVTGLERTRYAVVARQMALHPQDRLTREGLQAARRRLAELPAAQLTRLSYRPGEQGRAQVDAVVLERPLAPSGMVPLGALGLRALSDRELTASLASPTGGGELWTAAWRWWAHRPRLSGSLAAPAPFGGTWQVEGFTERQSYSPASGPGAAVIEESRRHAGVRLADWTGRGIRWDVEAGLDAWAGRGRALSLGAGVEQRFQDDRLALRASGTRWMGSVGTWTARTSADWRSSMLNEGPVWLARAGMDVAASNAPFALWSGAGTGQGRDPLLRAHPLLHDGIIRDGLFGRRVLHGGIEGRRWLAPRGRLVRVAPALFLDAARAWASFGRAAVPMQWDAGAGVRVALPGAGVMRVDVARGLRDGSTALSIGWTR